MINYLVVLFFCINFQLYSQDLFPILKIGNVLDTSLITIQKKEDSLFTSDNELKIDEFITLNHEITIAFFDTLRVNNCIQLFLPLRINLHTGYVVKRRDKISCVFSFNKNIDTLLIDSTLYIEINPFPNIYSYALKSKMVSVDSFYVDSYFIKGISILSFYDNGLLSSAAVYNNNYGSNKFYWDERQRLICSGAFFDNKKNGPWKYYNRSGKLICLENYKNGILTKIKGRLTKRHSIIYW